ncbi:MAG: beta-1,6-N-acetylglucosaminyltransferase [Lautropia sp.]|nr:beta-1,6-N-acetylglucosaminyltransferase [Lautropia sp.]
MRLAYQILAHQQPDQLVQLLEAIQHPDNLYLLQLDKKSLSGQEPVLQRFLDRHPNVIVAEPRDMRWVCWSVTHARLEGIARLLARPEPWQMLINLSGQDFPLATQDEIRAHFDGLGEQNFVETFEPSTRWQDPMARIDRVRLELPGMRSGWNVPKIRWHRWTRHLGDTRQWGGVPYMVLNRAFCQHLIDSPRLPAWKKALAHTYRPDEVMIPSFIMNSPFANTVQNRHFHAVDWINGSPNPRVLTLADYEWLDASTQLFARKFDDRVDAEILKRLQHRLTKR